jgi:adenylate cyclase
LFLDLRGSTDYTRAHDPKAVFTALNRMMAEFSGVLERRGATVTAYLGDGFMAVLREAHHAQRAVMAGLELNESLERFNRPRRILGLPLFAARIGISTGEVCLGNIGTYDKMDYTAIGATVNLAARLQYWADTAGPCISSSTYEQVRDHFLFSPQSPRRVSPKGLPECDVWDVVGCRD